MTRDLRFLNVGDKFTRDNFPHHGTYTVVAKRHGAIGIDVKTEGGRLGELYAWERVTPVK